MSDSESDVESDVKTAAPAKAATAKRRRISPLDADSSSSEEAEVSEESEEEEELDLADDDDESGEEATSLKPAVHTSPRRRSSRLRTIAKPKYDTMMTRATRNLSRRTCLLRLHPVRMSVSAPCWQREKLL